MAQRTRLQAPAPASQAESFGDRVRRLMADKGLTQKQLANRARMSQATISDIQRGRNKGTRNLVALADALGTSADYLKTGRVGELHHRIGSVPDRYELVQVPLLDVRGSMGRGNHQPEVEPVIEQIQVARRWIDRNLPALSSPLNLSAITAYGDSMAPSFTDGDILFVDTGITEIKIDAVYVISRESELFVKRIQRRLDGAIVIRSDNPVYEPQVVEHPDKAHLRVIGRVVWAWCGKRL